jgi:3-isopropylmalate/(R)-2-methylmalate dehydratase large subunit
MAQTLAEKILSKKVGRSLKAGDIVITAVDLVYIPDSSGPLALSQLAKIDMAGAFDPARVLVFIDHAAPSSRGEVSNDHVKLRQYARRHGLPLYDVGEGVCHQIAVEKHVKPGDLVIGADSHTCMGGALAAFATGMGSTDTAIAMALGKTWLRVPETLRIECAGALPRGVYGKDLALYLIGRTGAGGATYLALEFGGAAVGGLSMDDRLTLANMAVEAGAKTGLFPSDGETRRYLEEQGRAADWAAIEPDPGAAYAQLLEIELDALEPMVSAPHTVDNAVRVKEAAGQKLDQVVIGSCTNGRTGDFAVAAAILRGRKVHPAVRLILVPASRQVFAEALARGYIKDLVDAGGAVCAPSCGPCNGVQSGLLGAGEVCLCTHNRNFQGRMGSPDARIYIASAATAAASALTGAITDPREALS